MSAPFRRNAPDAPLRIGVNALRLVPCTDGRAESLLRNALRALASRFPADAFVVFGNRENRMVLAEDLREFPNVTLVALPVDGADPAAVARAESARLPRALRAQRAGVLWNPVSCAPRHLPCPAVSMAPDVFDPRVSEPATGEGFFRRLARRRERARLLRRAPILTTPSEYSRQELLRRHGIRFNRIAVIPPCADPAFADPIPAEVLSDRMMALLRGADPYLLCIADSHPDAGLETAVAAFAQLAADLPHRLVIVGRPGAAEAALQAAVAALPDPTRVIRLGYVDRHDLAALLQGSSLCLEPATRADGALSLLEAMTAGAPVVATHAGAIPEIGGEALRYVATGDADALADAARETILLPIEERGELVRQQTARARKFAPEATADALMALFRRLAESDLLGRDEPPAEAPAAEPPRHADAADA